MTQEELCKRSLAYFVQEDWRVLHPAEPLVWDWHMQAICDHLQAVTEGKESATLKSSFEGQPQ